MKYVEKPLIIDSSSTPQMVIEEKEKIDIFCRQK